jgi:cell division protein FtsB
VRSALTLFSSCSRPLVLTIVVALGVSCSSLYGFIGYFHYEQVAKDERLAAERAEHANADLQDALDRLRDQLAAARAQIEVLRNEPAGQLVISDRYKLDRVAQLTGALDQIPRDLHLTVPQPGTLATRLAWETTQFSNALTAGTSISIDQTNKLQRLSAERDEALAERDQLRARVGDLEQRLSSLQPGEALVAAPKVAPDNGSVIGRATAAAAAQGTATVAAAPEQPRQGFKNFASPVWVPDHFSDESGPIVGDPVARVRKRALNRKDGSA